MLPAERGEVGEEPVWNLLDLAQGGNGAIEIARVPQDDRGDQEVQARSSVAILLLRMPRAATAQLVIGPHLGRRPSACYPGLADGQRCSSCTRPRGGDHAFPEIHRNEHPRRCL
jgi:hypothetical protein